MVSCNPDIPFRVLSAPTDAPWGALALFDPIEASTTGHSAQARRFPLCDLPRGATHTSTLAMASRFEPPDACAARPQCENCGRTDRLLRCSRCHAAWLCSKACHKAWWPFHKAFCRPNEFADAVEAAEPAFAAWMRAHAKLAVLQDDEVDRLERSSQPGGWCGLGRAEVLERMYGRMDPSPAAPSCPASSTAPPAQQQADPPKPVVVAASSEHAWRELVVPEALGLSATRHKWWQDLTHVSVFVRLPDAISAKQVTVELRPRSLRVAANDEVLLSGRLAADIKVEGSSWFVADAVVHLQLLKRSRKGAYATGATAADTFWFSLLDGARGADRLPLQHPPALYYSLPCGE